MTPEERTIYLMCMCLPFRTIAAITGVPTKRMIQMWREGWV